MDEHQQTGGAPGVALTSGARWRGIVVEVRRQPPPPDVELFNDRHVVAFHLGRPHRLTQRRAGRSLDLLRRRGDILIDPADQPVAYGWQRPAEALILRLDPALIAEVAGEPEAGRARVELLAASDIRDATIEVVALALLGELQAYGLGGRLYAEALATTLAVHLLRHHSSLGRGVARQAERPPGGQLAPQSLRLVQEYIEAHLARDLALAELAAVAEHSARHFARLFRSSTGQPPHRYVVARRVERARSLLLATDLPMDRIALATGFADRGHLAAHFRRLVGVAPVQFRRRPGRTLADNGRSSTGGMA